MFNNKIGNRINDETPLTMKIFLVLSGDSLTRT